MTTTQITRTEAEGTITYAAIVDGDQEAVGGETIDETAGYVAECGICNH